MSDPKQQPGSPSSEGRSDEGVGKSGVKLAKRQAEVLRMMICDPIPNDAEDAKGNPKTPAEKDNA